VFGELGFPVGVSANISSTKHMSLQLANIQRREVLWGDLAPYFIGGVEYASAEASELAERGMLHAVTATLSSKELITEVDQEAAQAIKASVDAKPAGVGVTVSAAPGRSARFLVHYKGKQELTFAFQAQQLFFHDKQFGRSSSSGKDAYLFPATAGERPEPPLWLAGEETLVEIE
jgi:hypothetical protein